MMSLPVIYALLIINVFTLVYSFVCLLRNTSMVFLVPIGIAALSGGYLVAKLQNMGVL